MGELQPARNPYRRTASDWKSNLVLLHMLAIIVCTLLIVQNSEAAVGHTEYRINNPASAENVTGGVRFQSLLRTEEVVEILESAKEFILTTFNLTQEFRPLYKHTLNVINTTFAAVAVTYGDPSTPASVVTDLKASYAETVFIDDDTAWINEITGLLIHESTHAWQNNNGDYSADTAFRGIIEGTADYMRLKSEHYVVSPTVAERQAGGNWSDGYSTTAYFLDWIDETQVPNFVNKLNAMMVDSFTADFFENITGKSVDQLWSEYQTFLGTSPPALTNFFINNTALDTTGGLRFENDLGNENMLEVLRLAKMFIVEQFNMSQEMSISDVTLYVDNITGVAYTLRAGDGVQYPEIHLSAIYVDSLPQGDLVGLSYEITGVLVHESTHVWQNFNGSYGVDPVFTGVIEGIADFIRLRSGYPAKHWVQTSGGEWYSGYSTTAYFFDWIDATLVPGFVNELNYMMMNTWDVSFIEQITGMSADALWTEYQNYLNPPSSPSPSSSPTPSPSPMSGA
ncbi:unnamed protein product [Calypogeia fissa]